MVANSRATAFSPDHWDYWNQPNQVTGETNYNLSELPMEGTIRDGKHLWSGSYWPFTQKGIANRYLDKTKKDHRSIVLEKAHLKKVIHLSPAEKWDLYNSQYRYPFTREIKERAKKRKNEWEGLCNGWSASTIHYIEPKEVTVKNKEGLQIIFYPDDIKAIMAHFSNEQQMQDSLDLFSGVSAIGLRCSDESEKNSTACKDTNAGSFHLVLTNLIGIQKLGIIADVQPGMEVWNHPIIDFKSASLEKNLSTDPLTNPKAVTRERIQTTVTYLSENTPSTSHALGTENQVEFQKTYEYILELDNKGNIIGGEWISKDRPDFLWTTTKDLPTGQYPLLGELLKAAGVE